MIEFRLVNPDVAVNPSGLKLKVGPLDGRLQCVTNGYPKPTITWIKSGAAISIGVAINTYSVSNRFGKDLNVGLVSLSDNGTVYTCEVRQGTFVVRANSILRVECRNGISLFPC